MYECLKTLGDDWMVQCRTVHRRECRRRHRSMGIDPCRRCIAPPAQEEGGGGGPCCRLTRAKRRRELARCSA